MFKLTGIVVSLIIMQGSSMAASTDSPYEIYGTVHVSLDAARNECGNHLALVSNASLIGLRGNRSLNEKIDLTWQIESTVDPATDWSNSKLADRNSFLGFTSPWGTLIAGRHDMPFKTLGESVDLFRYELGDLRQITFDWDHRIDHAALYRSPDLGPLSADLAIQARGNAGAYIFGGSAKYDHGDVLIGVGFESWGKELFYRPVRTTYSIEPYEDMPGGNIVWVIDEGNTDPRRAWGTRAVARLNGDDYQVTAQYQRLTNRDGRGPSGAFFKSDDFKDRISETYGIGCELRMSGQFWMKAQVYLGDPNTSLDDDESLLYAIGCDYRLDSNTKLYIQTVIIDNASFGSGFLGGGTDGHGYRLDPIVIGSRAHNTSTDDLKGVSLGAQIDF